MIKILKSSILERDKVLFIGGFNKEYWVARYPNESTQYNFIEKTNIDEAVFSEYSYVFVAKSESKCIEFFYEYQKPIIIEIKSGTTDECASRIINFNRGFIGVDLCDLKDTLRCGKHPATYYSNLSVAEIKQMHELYKDKQGVFIFIHSPQAGSLEYADEICAQICELCSQDTIILWNIYFDKPISDFAFDIFISGE